LDFVAFLPVVAGCLVAIATKCFEIKLVRFRKGWNRKYFTWLFDRALVVLNKSKRPIFEITLFMIFF
jgi:hypothetical protein